MCLCSLFIDDDFFFGGGPIPDDKPTKSSVKQVNTGPVQGKASRVTGRLQVCFVSLQPCVHNKEVAFIGKLFASLLEHNCWYLTLSLPRVSKLKMKKNSKFHFARY